MMELHIHKNRSCLYEQERFFHATKNNRNIQPKGKTLRFTSFRQPAMFFVVPVCD